MNEKNENIHFKIAKRNGKKIFRQKTLRDSYGESLEIIDNGYDHISLHLRSHEKINGRWNDKKYAGWTLDSKGAVELGSILLGYADCNLRDSAEVPFYQIVTTKEKASFGQNWVNEDFKTAKKRHDNRKSRSHLFGIMKRFVELCENNDLVEIMAVNMATWAEQEKDEFSVQKSFKMFEQLNMKFNINFEDTKH